MVLDRYYYNRLNNNEKTIYKEIYKGCMEHKDLIPISGTMKELSHSNVRIVKALTDDNPLLYFINQTMMNFSRDFMGNMVAVPQYFFSSEKKKEYDRKIQDKVNRLIYELKLLEGSEADKVRKVHDYLCANIKYDYKGSDINNTDHFISAHSIIGVLKNKSAQCEGIAKTSKVLLNAVDVHCIFVTGNAEMDNGGFGPHGWNIVNIDGAPYHMDATMDIGAAGSNGYISYDYYNVTDEQIRINHEFPDEYPKCVSTDKNYFVINKSYFTGKTKLREYITNQIKSGAMMLYFRLGGSLRASEICNEMVNYGFNVLCDIGKDNVKGYTVVNEDMNTCRVMFK